MQHVRSLPVTLICFFGRCFDHGGEHPLSLRCAIEALFQQFFLMCPFGESLCHALAGNTSTQTFQEWGQGLLMFWGFASAQSRVSQTQGQSAEGGGGRTEASPPKIWVGRSSSLVGPAQALGLATRACVQSLVGLFTCACVHAPSRMHEREQRELCLFNAQAEK